MDELMRAAAFIRREVLALPAGSARRGLRDASRASAPYRAYLDNLRRRASRRALARRRARARRCSATTCGPRSTSTRSLAARGRLRRLLADIPWPKVQGRAGQGGAAHPLQLRPLPAVAGPRRCAAQRWPRSLGTLRQYQHAARRHAGRPGQARRRLRPRPRLRHRAGGLPRQGRRRRRRSTTTCCRTVNANLPLLHRYVELRKKVLGLPDVHLYDLYIPLVPGVETRHPVRRGAADDPGRRSRRSGRSTGRCWPRGSTRATAGSTSTRTRTRTAAPSPPASTARTRTCS